MVALDVIWPLARCSHFDQIRRDCMHHDLFADAADEIDPNTATFVWYTTVADRLLFCHRSCFYGINADKTHVVSVALMHFMVV